MILNIAVTFQLYFVCTYYWPAASVSDSTGPRPGPGHLLSDIASVQSENIFLDQTRSMCSICFIVFVCLFHINCTLHISHKKEVIDTASSGLMFYVVKW